MFIKGKQLHFFFIMDTLIIRGDNPKYFSLSIFIVGIGYILLKWHCYRYYLANFKIFKVSIHSCNYSWTSKKKKANSKKTKLWITLINDIEIVVVIDYSGVSNIKKQQLYFINSINVRYRYLKNNKSSNN